MPTNVSLPEDLLRQAEARAASEGRTLDSAIEHAVRIWLQPPGTNVERPPVPVSTKTGGLMPGINLDKTSELLEWLDSDLPLDQRR